MHINLKSSQSNRIKKNKVLIMSGVVCDSFAVCDWKTTYIPFHKNTFGIAIFKTRHCGANRPAPDCNCIITLLTRF